MRLHHMNRAIKRPVGSSSQEMDEIHRYNYEH